MITGSTRRRWPSDCQEQKQKTLCELFVGESKGTSFSFLFCFAFIAKLIPVDGSATSRNHSRKADARDVTRKGMIAQHLCPVLR